MTVPTDIRFDHVTGISWPRSGHHLLVRLLLSYFGPAFVYCEHHQGQPTGGGITQCCRKVPCLHRDRVVLTKNHDFHFTVPQTPGRKYLVQYRAFTPSVVSNFELAVRNGHPDTAEAFQLFVSRQFTQYLDFTSKWVTSNFAKRHGILILPYEDLIETPAAALKKAIAYVAPEHTPDEARIEMILKRVDGQQIQQQSVKILRGSGVHSSRNVAQFRYYSKPFFDRIDGLKLRREAVLRTFQQVLGRDPAETNMLAFQTYPDTQALADYLRGTEEYKALKHPDMRESR